MYLPKGIRFLENTGVLAYVGCLSVRCRPASRVITMIAFPLLCIFAPIVPGASADEVIFDLDRDFWNLMYAIDARVLDIRERRLILHVMESWTDYAALGDTVVLGMPSISSRTSREGTSKPRRLPFEANEHYLFLARTPSYLIGYGIPENGFYHLVGIGRSSFGDWYGFTFRPRFVGTAELDSLSVHIGNDPGFDDREFLARIAFPCGVDISLAEFAALVNSAVTSSLSESKSLHRFLPISFRIINGNIFDNVPHRVRLAALRNTLDLRSSVDSCTNGAFYVTSYLRAPIWSPKWLYDKLSSAEPELPILHLSAIHANDCNGGIAAESLPQSISLSGFTSLSLDFSTGSMTSRSLRRNTYFPGGDVSKALFSPLDSDGEVEYDSCVVLLSFSDIPANPDIPLTSLILNALAVSDSVHLQMFRADSLQGRFTNGQDLILLLDESARATLR